jgi:hypothetical protein
MADRRNAVASRVQFPPHLLTLGMMLDFTLYDERGRMLLARHQRIDSQHLLDILHARPGLFADQDESREPINGVMASLEQAMFRNAPLKDLDKFRTLSSVKRAAPPEVPLPQAWSDLEDRLRNALGHFSGDALLAHDAPQRIDQIVASMHKLMRQDKAGSLFLLVNRAITGFTGYSTLHSLLCAGLAQSIGTSTGLNDGELWVLQRAALTMNVSIKSLQDTMAAQKSPPTAEQLAQIDRHPTASANLLRAAGVHDRLWLDAVTLHHDPFPAGVPLARMGSAERLARVLQVIDRYTAALSPRGGRAGREAREATRAVVRLPGGAVHDEVGVALLQNVGLYPAGSYIKLVTGDVAVVLHQGHRPNCPRASTVVNKRGEPIGIPKLVDTAAPEHAVAEGLSGSDIRVRLSEELFLRQISELRATARRGAVTLNARQTP